MWTTYFTGNVETVATLSNEVTFVLSTAIDSGNILVTVTGLALETGKILWHFNQGITNSQIFREYLSQMMGHFISGLVIN